MLRKSNWSGNKWPCVEIEPYEYGDFPKVLLLLAMEYGFQMPQFIDILDGYAADFVINGRPVTAHMDNWFFSIASESEQVRDMIYETLQSKWDSS